MPADVTSSRGADPRSVVRPMTPDDLERVIIIDRLSFTLPWPESSYRFELYSNPAARLWVAEWGLSAAGSLDQPGGAVVGMIVVWLIVDEAHIATLAVHPDYRGLGLGKLLLHTALRQALQEGCISATLEVRQSNLAAQQLYRAFGFAEVGCRKRYYRDNFEDALIMTLSPIPPMR